jgi:hypothetical protein
MKLKRYKRNLKVEGDKIFSYNTHVATIDHEERKVYVDTWWSLTTSKHIGYVARELNYYLEKILS